MDDVGARSRTAGVLGTVYLPGGQGTPVGEYEFIVADRRVEVGCQVTAETDEGTVVGTVTDMRTVGVDRDPVSADLAGPGRIARIPEVVVATVQVTHSPALRPVRAGTVRAATAAEVAAATGAGRVAWAVPAGAVRLLDGCWAPVCLDGQALLGPESAHLMVGGLSGQAAKTSFLGVLLRSAVAAGERAGESVAAVVFNVKGADLLYLDHPPADGYGPTAEDLELYRVIGVDPTPFPDVVVYAPTLPGGGAVRSHRTDAAPLRWGLSEVWGYLRHFLPWLYEDDRAHAFVDQLDELVRHPSAARRLDTFDRLASWLDDEIAGAEEARSDHCWGGRVHVATARRMRRVLTSLPDRCGGLLTRGRAGRDQDVPDGGWSHGQVVVVDLAGITPEVQAVVIARTCERLLRSAEAGRLGVDHLVVVSDELNAFAPASGGNRTVVEILRRVATQGRYAGVSLWGAGQALSRVDELVRDNAATRALGTTLEAELSSGVHGRVPRGVAERIATLPRGTMVLWHHVFRGPVMVRFPRPAWRTGRPGNASQVGGELDTLGLPRESLQRLVEGVGEEVAARVVAAADDPAAAVAELRRRRVPDLRRSVLHEPSRLDPADPFALD